MAVNPEEVSQCAVGVIAARAEQKRRDDHHLSEPTMEELKKVAEDAVGRDVYGFDAKKDKHGNWIPQSIPPNSNHYNSIRKWEGGRAYFAEVRKAWREKPEYARKIGLPPLERLGERT